VTHDQTEAMTLADRIVVMNQRRIEQVGTPLEVYAHPATEFVAGFIGSPAMNLMPATPQASGEHGMLQLRLSDASSVSVPMPAGMAMPAGPLKLGLRPESVRLCAAADGALQGVVEFIEYLGDRTHVFVSLKSGERLVALSGGSCPFTLKQTVGLQLDVSAAHLFGADGRNHRMPP
jgi:multiple sugar transport system ATP-binding protein